MAESKFLLTVNSVPCKFCELRSCTTKRIVIFIQNDRHCLEIGAIESESELAEGVTGNLSHHDIDRAARVRGICVRISWSYIIQESCTHCERLCCNIDSRTSSRIVGLGELPNVHRRIVYNQSRKRKKKFVFPLFDFIFQPNF